MKILFVIKALGNPGGGAERVLGQVASCLTTRGHQVTLLTSDPYSSRPYYPLDESINVVNAGVGEVTRKSNWMDVARRIATCRRVIGANRPDVVVGFMHSSYVPVGISLLGTGIPMVASEHIGPEYYASRPLERMALYLTPMISRRITVVSEQIRKSYGPWLRRRMVVVANPVVVTNRPAQTERNNSDRKVLLSVGRLAAQKDHRTLLSAFARIAASYPDWILRIVGEGELRSELEAQADALGIRTRLELPGAVLDVDAEYQAADLFVLPSLYESFGLATAEALLHRLPAVGFADCPGTNELIVDDCNGLLVSGPDRVQALAGTLSMLFSRPDERLRLARSPRDELEKRFGLDGIVDRWEAVLKDACA